MNCEQAKEMIDLRVQEMRAGTRGAEAGKEHEVGGSRTSSPSRLPLSLQGRGVTAASAPGAAGACSPLPLGEGSGVRATASSPATEWADFDAHLETCARCRAELEEVERVSGLLGDLATDRPNDAEVQKMWTGIQTAAVAPSRLQLPRGRGFWARNKGLVLPLGSIAAVLALAFYLGEMRYGPARSAGRSASNINGIGTSATIFTNVDTSLPTGSAGDSEDDSGQFDQASPRYQRRSSPVREKRMLAPGDGGGGGGGQSVFQGSSAGNMPAAMAKTTPQAPPPGAPTLADNAADSLYNKDEASYLRDPALAQQDMDAASVNEGDSTQSRDSVPDQGRLNVPQNLKIIKTGELTLEVAAHADAAEKMEAIVRLHGGFIADATTQEESGGALLGRIVIRVPPDRFEQAFAALKPLGRVQAESVKAADVTAEYVDTDARIKSLQITEERLRELIANKSFVDKISSLLEVERELNRVRTDIEKLQGQLRVMDDRIALSTIVLTLREPGRTVPSASLSVEVVTLDEAAARLAEVLAEAGGRVVSGHTSKRGDGTLMGNYQLETTLSRFAAVVAAIEGLGRVQERQVRDQQFKNAHESWANRVKCTIALVLFERSRQLPSGSISLEVDGLEKAVEQIGEMADAHQASLASNQTHGTAEGPRSATIQLTVPAGHFARLAESLATLGRVTTQATNGEAGAIVGGAAAVPCNITVYLSEKAREVPRGSMAVEVAAFDPARQALSAAIRERQVQVLHSSSNQRTDGTWQGTFRLGVPAKEMEAFVSTLEGLGRVTGRQISGLGLGDLSRVNPDALGTIELTLGEKLAIAPGPEQAAGSIRARIRDGLSGFYQSIGLIAYGLVVLLPWLVLAGLLGWLVVIIRRRTNGKASVSQPAETA